MTKRYWTHLNRTIVDNGSEILVYVEVPWDIALDQTLDPFARFEPTERGWRAAQALCMSLV